METLMDHIGADEVFAEGFAGAAIAKLGDAYAGSKYLDDVTDVTSLVKRGMDTRAKNTELSEQLKLANDKLDTAVKRPGDTATDEEKAAYRKGLQAELGASDKVEDYQTPKPGNLPDGMPFDEESMKEWAAYFHSVGLPVEVAKGIVTTFNDRLIAAYNTRQADDKKAYDDAVAQIQSEHQPDDIKVMGRHVIAFLNVYGLKDTLVDGKTTNLSAMATEAGMFNTPDDFVKWKALDISPEQFLGMAEVGKNMSSGTTKIGGSVTMPSTGRADALLQNKINEQSPSMQIEVPAE